MEQKKEYYKGYEILAVHEKIILLDSNNVKNYYSYRITKNGKLLFTDNLNINGGNFTGLNNCILDAKLNIESINRMANDLKKYKKNISRNPFLHEKKINAIIKYHVELMKKVNASI